MASVMGPGVFAGPVMTSSSRWGAGQQAMSYQGAGGGASMGGSMVAGGGSGVNYGGSMVAGGPAYGGGAASGMGYGGSMVAAGPPYGGSIVGGSNYGGSIVGGSNYGGSMAAAGPAYTSSMVSAGPGGTMMSGGTCATAIPTGSSDACGCGPSASAGECAGACGGAETLCCEAESGLASVQWVPVGPGGSYAPVTSYQFVGEGGGTYERRVVTTYYGWRVRKCCLAILGLLLLAGLLYLLSSLFSTGTEEPQVSPPAVVVVTPAPTPAPVVVVQTPAPVPTPAPLAPQKTCLIFGDPHAMTFDGQRADYYTPGEYWIVKSNTVWIQGKYQPTKMTNGLSVTKEVGISGPFIGGHKLVIGVDMITWDNGVLQHGFENLGFSWHSTDPAVRIEYNSHGTVMQKSRVGKALHVVHVFLPRGVKIEVNRWSEPKEGTYVNVRIAMSPQPNQDGHCGNFDGNAANDERTAVRARVGTNGVPSSQLIFPGRKTVINPSGRPDLNDCPEGELKIAMEKCKAAEHKFFPSNACLIDTCLGHLAPKP